MLSQCLVSLGFKNSLADSSLFFLHRAQDLISILVYVDDILVTGDNSALITTIIQQQSASFALKDMGPSHYFLGIEALTTPIGLVLSQTKYALSILQKTGMEECRPCSTPSSLKSTPLNANALVTNPERYRSLVGSLQYLTLTRPKIAYVVNSIYQHMHCPLEKHVTTVKRILHYIKGILTYGLKFTKSSLTMN